MAFVVLTPACSSGDDTRQATATSAPMPTDDAQVDMYCEVYDETAGEMSYLGDTLTIPQRREYMTKRDDAAPEEIKGDWMRFGQLADEVDLTARPSARDQRDKLGRELLDYTERVCGFS